MSLARTCAAWTSRSCRAACCSRCLWRAAWLASAGRPRLRRVLRAANTLGLTLAAVIGPWSITVGLAMPLGVEE